MARGSIRQRSKKRQDSWTVQVYKGRDPQTGKKKYHSEAVKGTKAVAEGVTRSSWYQFQKASHRSLARRDLKASMGFTVSSFHHVPGNFNRS